MYSSKGFQYCTKYVLLNINRIYKLLIPEGVHTQTVPVLSRRREVVVELRIEYFRMWNLCFVDVHLFLSSAVDGVCRIAVPTLGGEHG